MIPRCPQCDAETSYHKDVTGFGAYRVQYCGNGCIVDRIVEHWADKGETAVVSISGYGHVKLEALTINGTEVCFQPERDSRTKLTMSAPGRQWTP